MKGGLQWEFKSTCHDIGEATSLDGLDDVVSLCHGDAAQLEVGPRGDVSDPQLVAKRLQLLSQHPQLLGCNLSVWYLAKRNTPFNMWF